MRLSTPTIEIIADHGVEASDLGHGIMRNQQLVMPYCMAYQEVRKSVCAKSTMGPVETLRDGLPKDSSDWNDVMFVSEKQVIEQLARKNPDSRDWQ